MAGFKDFSDGNTLSAAEVDGYLMQQTVMRFPTRAGLVAALGAGVRTAGMLAWADDSQTLYTYVSGGLWMPESSLWRTWSPTWSDGTSTLNPSNATTDYSWRFSGGMVQCIFQFTRGSTTNVGAGAYQWTLPVSATASLSIAGQGMMRDISPFTEYNIGVNPISGSAVGLLYNNARVSNSSPFTPATGDQYAFQVTYRPAESTAGGGIS